MMEFEKGERLIKLEAEVRHMREVLMMRDQHLLEQLKAIEIRQSVEIDRLSRLLEAQKAHFAAEVGEITTKLWAGLKWAAATLAVGLLGGIYKLLGW